MISRRRFVASVCAGALATLRNAAAQLPAKVWRLGFLSGGVRPADGAPPDGLRQALKDLGYADGTNIAFVGRWAEGKGRRLPELATELVDLKVDLLIAFGGPAAEAAKAATTSIPIVVAGVGDAVATGLVASFARPGGNITGISDQGAVLSAKRLELLKQAVPRASRIVVLWNADDRAMTLRYHEIEKAASVLGVTIRPRGVRDPDDFELAFAAMTKEPPDALFLVTDALTTLNRKRVVEFVAAHRIPAMYENTLAVREGGLMSYGTDLADNFRTVAGYVDKIFKGAKPADLPVEQPNRYYLLVNLATAKTLGLVIPQSVLLRADEVIQ
jgi:putative ABC transport system substrate-binding protein